MASDAVSDSYPASHWLLSGSFQASEAHDAHCFHTYRPGSCPSVDAPNSSPSEDHKEAWGAQPFRGPQIFNTVYEKPANPESHKQGTEESGSLHILLADCKLFLSGDHIKDTREISLSSAQRNSPRFFSPPPSKGVK
nr:uncharacterized protein LOC105479351 isoform X2 [Macaca nemestrina]